MENRRWLFHCKETNTIKLKKLIDEDRLSYDEFTHQIKPGQKYKGNIEIIGVSGISKQGARGRFPVSQIVTYKIYGKEKKEKVKYDDERFSYSNLIE